MVCSHLSALEKELINAGIKETFRGRAWTANCREWVYFDVVLDVATLSDRLSLNSPVEIHENDDPKSGLELGFVCSRCFDGIMGTTVGVKIFK